MRGWPKSNISPSVSVMVNNQPFVISMSRRRLARSTNNPAAGSMLREATERTTFMDPSIVPEPVMSYTSQLNVTCCIHWPAFESTVPVNKKRKFRLLSEENVLTLSWGERESDMPESARAAAASDCGLN